MPKERTWLDDLHDGARTVAAIASKLDVLSGGFELVGNMQMAHKLDRMSKHLEKAASQIHTGAGAAIVEYVKGTSDASRNMVNAVLANSGSKVRV
jgi:hypothetical protein